MDIYEIPNFVHDTTCDKIVGEIPSTPTIPADKVFPFYAGRSRYVESFPSRDVLTDIIDRINWLQLTRTRFAIICSINQAMDRNVRVDCRP